MSITAKVIDKFHSLLDEVIKLQEECKDLKRDLEILDTNSRQIFVEAVEILRATGMGDFEISELTREYLRKRIPERSLRKYLEELKPEETTEETQNNVTDENGNADIDDNKDIEQEPENPPEISVTTEGSQIATSTEPTGQEDLTEDSKPSDMKEHDPTELELAYIKIEQLETENEFLKEQNAELQDALKKTQQFKPATQLQEPSIDTTYYDRTFAYLHSKADGTHSFYYDTYGLDLFRNRELSQLKNSGVKVFKRLYFEV